MEKIRQELREPVRQEDGLGCAVASTAFVLGIPYQEALKLFKDDERRVKEEANFYCPELVSILNSQGLQYSWKKLEESDTQIINKDFTIIFIDTSPQYPFGHFLARYKNKWMDPWINLPDSKIAAGFREELPGKPTYAVFKSK